MMSTGLEDVTTYEMIEKLWAEVACMLSYEVNPVNESRNFLPQMSIVPVGS